MRRWWPPESARTRSAAAFVPRIRNGLVLLQAGMGLGLARGLAALMRSDTRGCAVAAHLPLGLDAIAAREAGLTDRVAELATRHAETDRAAFLDALRLRLDIAGFALEAAQSAMLQFGARGYGGLGSIPASARGSVLEDQFVAIVTPSVKHITAEFACGRGRVRSSYPSCRRIAGRGYRVDTVVRAFRSPDRGLPLMDGSARLHLAQGTDRLLRSKTTVYERVDLVS